MSDWSKQCNCTAHLQAPNKQQVQKPPGSHFHSLLCQCYVWQTKIINRAITNFPWGRRRLSRCDAYGHIRRSGAAVCDWSGRSPRNEDRTEHLSFVARVCLSMNEPPPGKQRARRRSERRPHRCRLFRCFWFQVRGTLAAPWSLHWLTRDLEMIATMEVGEKYSACLRQEDDNKWKFHQEAPGGA